MAKEIDVVLSPAEDLPAVDIWLVVDILRATTNIVHFFSMGGKLMIPVEKVDEARQIRSLYGDEWLLMGEREALPPEGFDLGNSPFEYTRDTLRDKPFAVITTSNGTGAMLKAMRSGKTVFISAARNASASVERAFNSGDRIGILCAGRHGRTALDDVLCAGVIIEKALEKERDILLSDGARIALEMWETCFGNLRRGVELSGHSHILHELGMEEDIAFCCEIDKSESVPRMTTWEDYPAFVNY
ncbi:MAG TPA: 2-phosphosulfolactate phosphatase [Synergistales bacterium]|nr:2-phosphosulfolactate phosphatase [Synergistales bacterium]